jgi:predicted DNA-binding transcriptional regulator YafY
VRADRLMAIVLLLQRYGMQTVPQLAKRLEVSERTILRDMDALSGSGVPVYAERGSRGGFRLVDGYRLDLMGLNSPEVRTLFLHRLDGVLSDLGWHHDAETARVKIAGAVSAEQMAYAEEVSQRFYVDESKWFEKPVSSPFLPLLQDAIWGAFRINLTYEKANGELSSRVVSPLALVAKAGVWYLVAQREGELRVYRVNRISNVELLPETFDRPKSFDLGEFWNTWTQRFMANLPRYEVVLWVERDAFETFVKHSSFPTEQIDANAPDGYVAVRVTYETMGMACGHVLSYDFEVVVVEPEELRKAVIQRAKLVLTNHLRI